MSLALRPNADGAFSAPLPMLERTRWQVSVENEKGDWRLEGSWLWPAERSIEIVADAAP